MQKPIRLLPARAWRTYLGGKLIDKLHGEKACADSNFPEEWLMSTVFARNAGREDIVEGMSQTEDGTFLKDLIDAAPEEILGARHSARFGAQTGVLVKLLDAGERLTVQVHPTREQAKRLFDSQYGKTECWHIVDVREDGPEKACIYLGFREGITRGHWQKLFDEQDFDGMLAALNRIEVKKGETYLIHGGVPHAIGFGCFLVEIQEPTDLTIRVERTTPAGLKIADFMCHQGLGFEKMFDCFDYVGYDEPAALAAWRIPVRTLEKTAGAERVELVGYRDTPMFCLQAVSVTESYTLAPEDVFRGLYVLEGSGTLDGEAVQQGDQFFLPANCGPLQFTGSMKLMLCYGPQCE